MDNTAEFLFQDPDCTEIMSIKLVSLQDHMNCFPALNNAENGSTLVSGNISLLYVLTNTNLYIIMHDLEVNRFQELAKVSWAYRLPEIGHLVFNDFTIYKNSIFLSNYEGDPVVLKIAFGEEIVARRSTHRESTNRHAEL